MTDPVSVIMTVRNGAPYVGEAVDSVLNQSDRNLELIVIDDGSTDETAAILAERCDERMKVESLPPIGRAEALARAVRSSNGTLLAVLDADDVALPDRIAQQRRFLDEHPEVALVGSAAIEFDENREWTRPVVSGARAVRRALGMYNPFFHSSVMFRRSAYDAVGGYRPDGGWGHDKDLVVRIASRFDVDIIAQPLIRYRHHPRQWSTSRSGEGFRRRKSAWLQLRAARALRLPILFWSVPLMAFAYAHMPSVLRPRRLKGPVKRAVLRLFGADGAAARTKR